MSKKGRQFFLRKKIGVTLQNWQKMMKVTPSVA